MLIQKFLLNAIAKQFRLEEVLDYVFKPNKNNEDIKKLKKDNKQMKADIKLLKKLYTKEK
jgi:hypothetical protein